MPTPYRPTSLGFKNYIKRVSNWSTDDLDRDPAQADMVARKKMSNVYYVYLYHIIYNKYLQTKESWTIQTIGG